jgi:hypothetical protein
MSRSFPYQLKALTERLMQLKLPYEKRKYLTLCNKGGDTQRINAVRESILADGALAKISREQALG